MDVNTEYDPMKPTLSKTCIIFLLLVIGMAIWQMPLDTGLSPEETIEMVSYADADTLVDRGKRLYDLANYDSARWCFNRARAIYHEFLDHDKDSTWQNYISCFLNEARSLIWMSDFDKAGAILDSSLKIIESVFGRQSLLFSEYLYIVAELFFYQNNYDRAEEFVLQSISARQKLTGVNDVVIARSYNFLGHLYYYKRAPHVSIDSYEKAIDILTRLSLVGDSEIANSFQGMGYVHYIYWGETRKALEFFNRALAIRKNKNRDSDLKISELYDLLGQVYIELGDYTLAEQCIFRAYRKRKKILGAKHEIIADSYLSIGNFYVYCKHDLSNALDYYEKALSIRNEAYSHSHRALAILYESIGEAYSELGDFDEATRNFDKAFALLASHKDHFTLDFSRICWGLAKIYREQADYKNAHNLLSVAIDLIKNHFGDDYSELDWYYYELGHVNESMGELRVALTYYKKGLSLSLKNFGSRHPHSGEGYSRLANVYLKQNRFVKALGYFKEDLEIHRTLFGENHPYVADSFENMGAFYIKKREFKAAIFNYQKALSIRLNVDGKHHPSVARCYRMLAEIELFRGRFEASLEYLQESMSCLRSSRTTNPTDSQTVLRQNAFRPEIYACLLLRNRVLESILQANYNLTNLENVVRSFKEVLDLSNQIRRSYGTSDSKFFLNNKSSGLYERAISHCVHLLQLRKMPDVKEKIFFFSEGSRAGILLDQISTLDAREFIGIPDSLLKAEFELNQKLVYMEERMIQMKSNPEEADSLRDMNEGRRILQLRRQHENLIRSFETDYPEYYDLKYNVETVSIKQLQDHYLDSNSVLIEYFVGDSSLFIFAVAQDTFDVVRATMDSTLEKGVELLRQGLASKDYRLYIENAFMLYEMLLSPVKSHITGKNLIIIPDGVLGYIPFEALLTRKVKFRYGHYKELPYVIRDHQVNYGYSATLLYRSRSRGSGKVSRVAAFAPVVFN